jgi:hypothetical protein
MLITAGDKLQFQTEIGFVPFDTSNQIQFVHASLTTSVLHSQVEKDPATSMTNNKSPSWIADSYSSPSPLKHFVSGPKQVIIYDTTVCKRRQHALGSQKELMYHGPALQTILYNWYVLSQ